MSIRDLREDAAGDPQRGGAQRFTDGEPDEAGTGVVAGNEQQDAEHEEQLHADEEHPDAHARLERDRIDRKRLARETREGRARIGEGVDPDPEPGHSVAAADADEAEGQDDEDLHGLELQQRPEVEHDDDPDEGLEEEDELPLGDQVRLARLVNQLRDLAHRLVHGEIPELDENHEAEEETEHTHDETPEQQRAPVDPREAHLREVGHLEVGFAAAGVRGRGRRLRRRSPGRRGDNRPDGGNQECHQHDEDDATTDVDAPARQSNARLTHRSLAPCRGQLPLSRSV